MKLANLGILTFFLASVLTGCNSAESTVLQTAPVRPVKLLTIGNDTEQQTRIFPAKIAANQQADLAFRINGELIKLDWVEGQRVEKGALLAQLDDRDAKNALLNAEANFELAEADFQRKAEILKQKLISKAEFDSAKATLKSAKAALYSARDQLDYTRLTAPFSGIIAKIELDNYQMVQATQVVLSLQGDALVDVEIQVPESLYASLQESKVNPHYQPKVRFNGQSKLYPVSYKEHASKVTPNTQTYTVVFSFAPPKNITVLPGMSAELLVSMSEAFGQTSNVIAVLPQSALLNDDDDGQTKVWRYDETTLSLTAVNVSLGQVRSNGIEIVAGLNQGDQVVAVGAAAIKASMQVKPLRWERGI
jgi:RND family efflux transporter MFP subunit